MKELKGTEKQIAYANTVREYVLSQIEGLNVKGLEYKKAQLIKGIEKIGKAEVILNSFVSAFRNKEVSAKAVDFLTYRSKFTQNEILWFSNTAVTINENLKDIDIIAVEKKVGVKEEPKSEVKVVYATEKQITFINELKKNLAKSIEDISFEIYKDTNSIERQLSKEKIEMSTALYIIDALLKYQFKANKGPKFFTVKFDTVDCETTEKIEAGELAWRDSEGIHRADNY